MNVCECCLGVLYLSPGVAHPAAARLGEEPRRAAELSLAQMICTDANNSETTLYVVTIMRNDR